MTNLYTVVKSQSNLNEISNKKKIGLNLTKILKRPTSPLQIVKTPQNIYKN